MKHYKAHWETLLIVLSAALTLICLVIAAMTFANGGRAWWIGILVLSLVVGSALFTIRGYTVTQDAILVHRLFWTTRLSRDGLQSAQFEPNAMRWSIRTFGNGGFFSFSGFYYNKLLGTYRAFVTDRQKTVVLRYSGRTVVLSPASPEEFAHEFMSRPGVA